MLTRSRAILGLGQAASRCIYFGRKDRAARSARSVSACLRRRVFQCGEPNPGAHRSAAKENWRSEPHSAQAKARFAGMLLAERRSTRGLRRDSRRSERAVDG